MILFSQEELGPGIHGTGSRLRDRHAGVNAAAGNQQGIYLALCVDSAPRVLQSGAGGAVDARGGPAPVPPSFW